MLVLCSNITVGDKSFRAVNDVNVKRSIYQLASTAKIKVPVTAVLRRQGEPPTHVQTAQQIKVGDKVDIRLGYNGRMAREFRGYVKAVNLTTPVEIVCEDEFWSTRNRNITTSGTITLKALLGKCGLEVAFAEVLTLHNFAVPNQPVSTVLAKIKKDYGLCVFFDLDDKVYACRPERVTGNTVKYELRRNVINDDGLQYKNRSDVKIRINAVCFKKDGSKIEAKKGAEGGAEKTLYFYDIADAEELATLVDAELKKHSYDGYDGSITTFLEPFAAPAMIADLVDPVYPERSGKYYIEGVETSFGMSGGRRKVEIGSAV